MNRPQQKNPRRLLLLVPLLLTGVMCKRDAVFVYSRLGGDVFLPCTGLVSPGCSSISWNFYKGGEVWRSQEVLGGPVTEDPDKSTRVSITSDCSLRLSALKANDAGGYFCKLHGEILADVYLSLLTITSTSTISDLQPGGSLSLTCILFTYYDAGSCKSYSHRVFNLSWEVEDKHRRYELINHTRCNITLTTTLHGEDHNRKWRCQVNTMATSRAVFLDFTSTFLLQIPPTAPNQSTDATTGCPVQLPISRIMLCVGLPVMALAVGFFTWGGGRKRPKTSPDAL